MSQKQTKLVTLTLLNRITLPVLLPSEGGFTQLIVLRALKKKIEITAKEVELYKIQDFKSPSGKTQLSWDLTQYDAAGKVISTKKDEFKYDLNEAERKEIRNMLQKLFNEDKLTEDLLDLCIYFEVKVKTKKAEPK